MKRLNRILLVSLVSIFICGSSLSHIKFSSNNAAISVASGARLVVDSSSMRVDGTIIKSSGASILGNQINFNHGTFVTDGVDILLTASFSSGAQNTINLRGNGKLVAQPGFIIQAINISNKNNRIEGQPFLQNPITLQNSSAAVNLALQSTLDENIVLNGGAVSLDNDLVLGDDAGFLGSGTITLSGHSLALGGLYHSPWQGNLMLSGASDIALNGNLVLDGNWTFSGNCVLNGNGSVLDLSGGGSIIVEHGSILALNDLTITGVGTGAGSLSFNGASSEILTNNVAIRLVNETTTSKGNIYVQGPTTFITSANSWIFNQSGKLTVDGTTLWIDQLSNPSFSQGLFAPLALYGTTGLNDANVASDIASGNLALSNGGIVRMVNQSTGGGSNINPLSGSITTTVVFAGDIFLAPKDYIRIDANIMIDGGGSAIHFSEPTSPHHSQLIIAPGKVLTLQNVRLLNLSDPTFDIRHASRINIGSNVLFELSQDITFSSGLIHLAGSGASSHVFTVQGNNGQRTMKIAPTDQTSQMLELGTNTLLLDNIELSGFDYISFINSTISGAVALTDNARATLDNDTAMNFFVEGSNNEFVLQYNGINLSGNIAFGGMTDNSLHIRFALDALPTYGSQPGNPTLILSGDPGIYLSAFDSGLARLFFDDASVSLVNAGQNAFVVDAQSYLKCRNLEILENAIKQSSALFTFDAVQLSGLQIDPSYIRSIADVSRSLHVLPTAISLKRQKEREALEKVQELVARQKQEIPVVKPLPQPKNGTPKKPTREILDFDDREALLTRAARLTHALPTVFDQRYLNMTFDSTSPLSGTLEFNAAVVRNVTVNASTPFDIILENGSRFDQGDANITLNASQYISVVGLKNVINVTKTMTIGNNLFFEEGGELTFNFVKSGQDVPTVIFAKNTILDLPKKSILRFFGQGQLILHNGVTIRFQGLKSAREVVEERPQFIIASGAIMSLAQSARVAMKGIGGITVIDRGGIRIDSVGSLIIGGDTTYVERLSDFELNVIGDGFINLTPSTIPSSITQDQLESKGVARLSFQRTTVSVNLEDSGMLLIGNSGRFEINAEAGVLKAGKIEALNFCRNGFFDISGTGQFVLGDTIINQALAVPVPFSWDGQLVEISGDGFVRYIGTETNKSFMGRLSVDRSRRDASHEHGMTGGCGRTRGDVCHDHHQESYHEHDHEYHHDHHHEHLNYYSTNALFGTSTSMTSEYLASLLVQEVPALRVSTVYTDQLHKKYLRTVRGIDILLHHGDVIVSDDGLLKDAKGLPNPFYGYVEGFDGDRVAFRYTPDGRRI